MGGRGIRVKRAMVVLGGAALGAIAGLFLGALFGGNFASSFQFLHLRGYEATGVLGMALGALVGGVLGAR